MRTTVRSTDRPVRSRPGAGAGILRGTGSGTLTLQTGPTDDHVRLEGFHAVKHALRFGARLTGLVTPDAAAVEALRAELAPDLDLEAAGLAEVTDAVWREARGARPLPSPLLGHAARRSWGAGDVGAAGRLVVVEHPRHLGNLGAVVRVAAAASAAGVVAIGDVDVWHPTVVRAAAGLHFALPVIGVPDLDGALRLAAGRPLVALDERGTTATSLPGDAALLLGSERHGLTPQARAAADTVVRIAMREGVSSLNLATAVAVALYAPGA